MAFIFVNVEQLKVTGKRGVHRKGDGETLSVIYHRSEYEGMIKQVNSSKRPVYEKERDSRRWLRFYAFPGVAQHQPLLYAFISIFIIIS